MLNTNDDDDFFTATSASNLANLFGTAPGADASATLIYTAPKQPKVPEPPESSKQKVQNKLICVKTIQLYHLVETEFAHLGKYGIAIIGDSVANSYNLIVYKTKQNIISSSSLNKNFVYNEQECVGSFCDDWKQTMRVHFDDLKDSKDFSQELTRVGVQVKVIKMDLEDGNDCMSDSSGAQARANILDRISKVGQSILPNSKNVDLSESEIEDVVKAKRPVRKQKRHSISEKDSIPEKNHSDLQEPSNQQFMVPVSQAPSYQQQQYMLLNGQYVPSNMMQPNQMMMPTQMMPLNDPFNIYFAESRSHNSEVRMNLTQLSNKLETMMSEITKMNVTPSFSETDYLHEKIKELERKLTHLSKGDSTEASEAKALELKQANDALQININELTENIQSKDQMLELLQKEVSTQRLKIKDLVEFFEDNRDSKMIIVDLNEQLSNLRLKQETSEVRLEELQEEVAQSNKLIENQKLKLKDFEEYHKKHAGPDKLEAARLEELQTKAFSDLVKESMNSMYQNILERMENGGAGDVKRALMQNMKKATFQIIEGYNENRTGSSKGGGDSGPPPVPEFEVTV
ncbi:PREDICTED: coiled-coil domain-containing protein 18-like [Nicrophorus vespilloides]|uniref:Coiled-coil domain-containing protein 18-like n=1 Tax=Nicrophorus vespilloides TaxID=110193 RepID=A0ABM1ML98_NICVS|nr:PREDICTED: coiled-coil domain-containing protein 18-like [Nicrophorus vespilloides]